MTSPVNSCEQPQRRRSAAKTEQILKAARELFLSQGYGAVSMDEVANRAGVSKATVYNHFNSKEQLFGAIFEHGRAMMQESGLDLTARNPAEVEQTLHRLGQNFMRVLLSPDALAFYRMLMSEVWRFPELGPMFYDSKPCAARDRLAGFLARAAEHGLIAVDEPELAAEQFFGMIRGLMHLRGLFGVGLPNERELTHRVEHAVNAFLRAYPIR